MVVCWCRCNNVIMIFRKWYNGWVMSRLYNYCKVNFCDIWWYIEVIEWRCDRRTFGELYFDGVVMIRVWHNGGTGSWSYSYCEAILWWYLMIFWMWKSVGMETRWNVFHSVFDEASGSGELFNRPDGLGVRSDRQSGGVGALNGNILFLWNVEYCAVRRVIWREWW